DPLGVLIGNEAERHLEAAARGHDRLDAVARVADPDADDVAGRARPHALERGATRLALEPPHAGLGHPLGVPERQPGERRSLGVAEGTYVFVEAGDRNPALG